MGVTGLAVAVGAVVLAVGTASLMQSLHNRRETTASVESLQLDEFNRNTLVRVTHLLSNEKLKVQSNKWIGSGPIGAVIGTKTVGKLSKSTVDFTFCDPKKKRLFNAGGALETACNDITSTVYLDGSLPDGRTKVTVVTANGSGQSRAVSAALTGKSNCPINFEEFAEGTVIGDLTVPYGVTFVAKSGGSPKIARVAPPGSSKPFFEAWWSNKCKGKPNRNRLCFGGSKTSGSRVLSVSNALNTHSVVMEIHLSQPVQELAFDLIDVDGGESWTFTAKDDSDNVVAVSATKAKGYGGDTGNSKAARRIIKSGSANIKVLRMAGTKGIKIFGFGLDNIETGLPGCPVTP